jgi:hypothetical protein
MLSAKGTKEFAVAIEISEKRIAQGYY